MPFGSPSCCRPPNRCRAAFPTCRRRAYTIGELAPMSAPRCPTNSRNLSPARPRRNSRAHRRRRLCRAAAGKIARDCRCSSPAKFRRCRSLRFTSCVTTAALCWCASTAAPWLRRRASLNFMSNARALDAIGSRQRSSAQNERQTTRASPDKRMPNVCYFNGLDAIVIDIRAVFVHNSEVAFSCFKVLPACLKRLNSPILRRAARWAPNFQTSRSRRVRRPLILRGGIDRTFN